jgi:hypothetical protein
MVSRSLLGPHRKMYANTPTSTTRVQQHQCSTCCLVALALHQLHPCVATTRPRVASALHQQRHTSGCLSSSRSPSSTTAPMSCIRTRRLRRSTSHRTVALAPAVRPVTPSRGSATRGSVALALLRLRRASGRAVSPLDFSSVGHAGCCRAADHSVVRRDYSSVGRNESTSNKSRVRVPRHVARLVTRLVALLVIDYFDYAVRPGASARRAARHAACRAARLRLLRLCRASGCVGTSCGSSHGLSSTTSPRAGLLSTTAPMSCIQTRRLCRSTSCQTVALAPVVCPVTPSRGSATRGSVAPALLRLRCASGRVVSPLDFSSVGHAGCCRVPDHSVVCRDYSSPGRNESTSNKSRVRVPRHVARLVTRLVVDYFAYAAHPGASARRAARRAARRRLLRLSHASECLGTSRGSSLGSSRRSSSITSTTPRVRMPRHIARPVTRLFAPLVIDYSTYASCRHSMVVVVMLTKCTHCSMTL